MLKTPNLTQAEINYIKQNFGADEVYIDILGNIRDETTNQIIVHHKDINETLEKDKVACGEYFNGLPIAVKNELLKEALEYSVKKAKEQMNTYGKSYKTDELWGLSYEELVKITAEGILLNEN